MNVQSALQYVLHLSLETKAASLFIILLGLFLFFRRKRLTLQKIIFPALYALLYKTKYGLKRMDRWAKKYPRTLNVLALIGIWAGFIGMIAISATLLVTLFQSLFVKEAPAAVGLVLPIKAKGVFHVPFFYWIIAIFLLAIVHEFAHGVVARLHNLKVKSSGFAFFCVFIPLIPAAFVEPDEKELVRRKPKQQLAVFAAGPFANVLFAAFALLLFLALVPLVASMVLPDGIKVSAVVQGNITYPAELAGLKEGDIIYAVDSIPTPALENFTAVMLTKKSGDTLLLETSEGNKSLVLAANPSNASLGFIGITPQQNIRYADSYASMTWLPISLQWLLGLFIWLYILNLGIGLFNLLPLGPLDGGRMFLTLLLMRFPKKKAQNIWTAVSLFFLIIIVASIIHSCTM